MRQLVWVITLLLAGCAATGVQVSESAAMQFKEGSSTEAEILAKLGKPTTVMRTGATKMLVYSGYQSQVKGATFIPIVGAFAGGGDYSLTSAVYEIDAAGVLQRVSYSNTNSGTRLGATPAPMVAQEPRSVP